MGKLQVIGRIYGYVVCLTVICWGLYALSVVVEAAFDLTDPLHGRATRYSSDELSSYEAFRLNALKSVASSTSGPGGAGAEEAEPAPHANRPAPLGLTDKVIRTMYEQKKSDAIRGALLAARRDLVKNAFLLLACVGLFAGHWRWLRRLPKGEA